MIDLGSHIINIPGAIILIVVHKNRIDTAAIPLGNVPGPLLQLLPLVKGKQIADVKDIIHQNAVRTLCILFEGLFRHSITAISRSEKILHEFRHHVHSVGKRHSTHIHIA